LSFVRWSADEKLIIVSNFDADNSQEFQLKIPQDILKAWDLGDGNYKVKDELYKEFSSAFVIKNGVGSIKIKLKSLESFILKVD
jgi:hypothetical protein